MNFESTHEFLGEKYMAFVMREDNSGYCFGNNNLVPSKDETIWLYSEEDWESSDSAEYGIKPDCDWLIYPDGLMTDHTVDKVKAIK